MKLKFIFLITALLLLGNLTTWGQTYTWNLVTDVTTLAANDVVIIAASNANYALSTTQNNNRPAAAITKNTENNTCTITNDVQELILKTGTKSGTLAFNDEARNGYLYAASSGSNWLKTETNLSDNSSWVITISGGVATITAQGDNKRNILKYNPNNNNPIFSCYSSGQQPVCLYKKVASGPTTYPITIPTLTNGSVTASPNPAAADDTITLTATPDTGYVLNTISATYGDPSTSLTLSGTGNTRTFTMPAAEVNVTATFSPITYNITAAAVTNGTITVNGTAAYGSTVDLSAAAADGYSFVEWSVYKTGDPTTVVTVTNSTDPDDASFTMPAYDVTVSATFNIIFVVNIVQPANGTIKVANSQVTFNAVEGVDLSLNIISGSITTGYYFGKWLVYKSDDPTTEVTVIHSTLDHNASFTMPAYNVTVSAIISTQDIEVNAASIKGYNIGEGPSEAQSFTLQGTNLTNNIIVSVTNGSEYFEISETATGTYSSSYTITSYLNAEKTGYVRLKAGLAVGSYSGDIFISSPNAYESFALNGRVNNAYTVTINPGTGSAVWDEGTHTQPFNVIVPEYYPIYLSNIVVTPPTGWTFYGWATASVEATQTTPTIISGTTYTPTDNVTLYAVYKKTEGGNPSPTAYTAGDEGDFVLAAINDNKYYSIPTNPTLSSGKISGVEITVSTGANDVLYVSTPNANGYSWTIANSTNGQTIYDGSNYLYHSNGGGSGTNLAYGSNTNYTWSIISEANGLSFRAMNGTTTNGRGLLMSGTTFGGYSLNNEDGTGYYRLLVLPIATSVTTTYNTNPAANGPCATPTFSLAEGYYYTAQSVVLSCTTTGATIRYTTDGTEPTAESTVYDSESPITLSTTTTIKAKAYCSGYDPSATATATYNFMPNVAGTYVIAYKAGENYYAMSQTANEDGNKLTSQTVTLNGDGAVVTSENGGLLWTIANTTNGVAIKPINDTTNYLNIGYHSLTIASDENYFQVISRLEEVYSFKAMTSNYAVEYYGGLFTSYTYNDADTLFNFYLLPYVLPATYTVSIAEGISNGSISSVTSASEGDEITVTVNPDTDYKLSTLYYYTTDPATTTAIDLSTLKFSMPAVDVTIGATFEPILYWHITLSENGASSTIDVQQGLSTTLPAPTNIPDGYTFAGWTTSTVSVINTVPTTMVATEYTPSADVTLYAVYAISNVSGNYSWNLVTDATTLAAGDKFMLYGQKSDGTTNKVAGSLTSSYLTAINVSAPVNNQISQPEGAEIFTLAAGQDGKWIFVSHNGEYLKTGVGYSETAGTEWTITIDPVDGDATISVGTSSLQFNSSEPRFKTYTSNQSYTALYRNTQESALMNYSTNITALSGTLTTQTYNTNCYISGATTIPNGVTVTCNYGLGNTNPANLIIEDGGQLIIDNAGVQAIVEKGIAAWVNDDPDTPENETSGWYSISSPVRDQSIALFTDTTHKATPVNLYAYDEPSFTWLNYHSGSITETTLIPGKGYLTANKYLTTRKFVGELNNESITVALSYASTYDALKGFNFVGNPYSHNITIENNATVSTNVATGYYKLIDGVYTASANDIIIAPKEGFFVKANAMDQTITFNNLQSGSKQEEVANDEYLSIEVNNSKHMDRAYAMFNNVIGLTKVSHMDVTAPMLYIPQAGKDYAITSVEPTSENIPVSFEAGVDGTYTITVKQHNCSLEGLILKDMKTGMLTELSTQNSYTFEAAVGDAQGRFCIILATHGVEEQQANEVFVYQSGNNLIVNGEGWVELIDLQGRVLSRQQVTGNSVNIGDLSAGIYMVRLIDKNKVSTQKVVVK